MRYSGLAITDTVTLERQELQRDPKKNLYRVVTSRAKTGTHVSVPIPDDVAREALAVMDGNPRYGTTWHISALTPSGDSMRAQIRIAD
jgi:hypothetical protein